MAPRRKPLKNPYGITWPANTELVGLRFVLRPVKVSAVNAPYTTGLHAWFLDQVRQHNPTLAQRLHDDPTQKAFTISGLDGQFIKRGEQLSLVPQLSYNWTITAFSREVVYFLGRWLASLPERVALRGAPLEIVRVELALPAICYQDIIQSPMVKETTFSLSFVSPTSFRRKNNHFPLPLPMNLFQSYLRRWNLLSERPLESDPFLDWVDRFVVIRRVSLQSDKVAVGKGRGLVTGFVGAVELGVDPRGFEENAEFLTGLRRLGQYAPYCGTGHKTTFGLGQTVLGWQVPQELIRPLSTGELLEARVAELTTLFFEQRKRKGGVRAQKTARLWAKILARRELGESLVDIAMDLEMKYETVNRYAKLARAAVYR